MDPPRTDSSVKIQMEIHEEHREVAQVHDRIASSSLA